MKAGWNSFELVSEQEISRAALACKSEYKPDRCYKNNLYIVQVKVRVFRKGKTYDRVMIRRHDAKPILDWQHMFRIKNELFGEETEAIQFLPPKSELIDSANLYWFWIEVE